MKYAYYPGCSLHSTGEEYDLSLRAVCGALGVELQELEGWICCGTTAAHASSRLLSYAMPVQNLSLVEATGINEVVVPCASCFARLKDGHHEFTADPKMREKVNRLVDTPYKGTVKVLHPLDVFAAKDMLGKIETSVRRNMSHAKVACYYGCLLTRPPKVMKFDNAEYPMTMDKVLRAAGMATVDWDFKTMCCGAAFALSQTDIVLKLCAEILDEAKGLGANAIGVACPLCHANLDTRQTEIEEKYGKDYKIPVFYFTQLLGLALDIPGEIMGCQKHLVSTDSIVYGGQASAEQAAQH